MSESILIKLAVNISVHMVIVGPCGDEQIMTLLPFMYALKTEPAYNKLRHVKIRSLKVSANMG